MVVGVDDPDFTMLEMGAAYLEAGGVGGAPIDLPLSGPSTVETVRAYRLPTRATVPCRPLQTLRSVCSARGVWSLCTRRLRYVLSLPPFFQRFHGDYNSRFLTLGGGKQILIFEK